MVRRAGAIVAAVLSLACPARERPQTRAGDGGPPTGKRSGPPVGQVVLRTDDPWLRCLSFDADTLFFVANERIRHDRTVFVGDGIFAVDLGRAGPGPAPPRRLVAAPLPDRAAWARMLRAEEEAQKAGAAPGPMFGDDDNPGATNAGPTRFWLSSSGGRLFWIEDGDLKVMTPPGGAIETFAHSLYAYDVVADEVLWRKDGVLMHRRAAGGDARVLLRSVRGTTVREGANEMIIAQAAGKRTTLLAYRPREDAPRVVGSVPFTARPLAADDARVYLAAGARLLSLSTATGSVAEIGRAGGEVDSAVIVGPFVLWQARDSWKLWRRRRDSSDAPTTIAAAFRIEAVCGALVMVGESSGRIRALNVADGSEQTIATSPERAPARYLFRAAHHLFWQANGTIYRAPVECEGPDPLPPRGLPPMGGRQGSYTIDADPFP
ncbi:MAG TPA: hypothetical protein VIF57_27820 [Polyangia bacterium]|jgi:hypothetical protein